MATSAFAGATLDALLDATASFSIAIRLQLEVVQSDPVAAELAKKTIEYAEAKTTYFRALRAATPELTDIATHKQARPPELEHLAEAFSLAGEKQEVLADQKTLVLLKRFSGNPEKEQARAEFERAQKIEEQFHEDFDGVDFT